MTPSTFVLRHGRSVANEQGRIVSSLANAEDDFGLTDEGRRQAHSSVADARGRIPGSVTVFSSPLLRARQTAEIAAAAFDATVRIDHRLIERGFGELELASDDRYEAVWKLDRRDPTHRTWGVESVVDVWARIRELFDELRNDPDVVGSAEASIILVSHGDVASTLICGSRGEPLNRHREVGALGTAELCSVHWPRVD